MKISKRKIYIMVLIMAITFAFFRYENHRNLGPYTKESLPSYQISTEDISSEAFVVIKLKTHLVLAEKNATQMIYPASMTKMMTALVTLDCFEDLHQTLFVPEDIFEYIYEQDASTAGFYAYEQVSILDLLYGILLPSGADACLTVEKAVGSDLFIEKMNQKAKDLNMTQTHFANTTGLHEDDHVSSVTDMAILLEKAIENETFMEIISATEWITAPDDVHPEGILFKSRMHQFMDALLPEDIHLIGGKTGFTGMAGLCMASVAEIDGELYLVVSANAEVDEETMMQHFLDAIQFYIQIDRMPYETRQLMKKQFHYE